MENVLLESVESLALQHAPSERLRLVEHLARSLRQDVGQIPARDLYGIWRDKFPPNSDIDVTE